MQWELWASEWHINWDICWFLLHYQFLILFLQEHFPKISLLQIMMLIWNNDIFHLFTCSRNTSKAVFFSICSHAFTPDWNQNLLHLILKISFKRSIIPFSLIEYVCKSSPSKIFKTRKDKSKISVCSFQASEFYVHDPCF